MQCWISYLLRSFIFFVKMSCKEKNFLSVIGTECKNRYIFGWKKNIYLSIHFLIKCSWLLSFMLNVSTKAHIFIGHFHKENRRSQKIRSLKIRIDLFKYLHPKKLKMNVYSAVQCFFQKSLKSETEWDKWYWNIKKYI